MRWTSRDRRKRRWKRWFAWRPVHCHCHTVWLEKVSYRHVTSTVYGYIIEWKAGWGNGFK